MQGVSTFKNKTILVKLQRVPDHALFQGEECMALRAWGLESWSCSHLLCTCGVFFAVCELNINRRDYPLDYLVDHIIVVYDNRYQVLIVPSYRQQVCFWGEPTGSLRDVCNEVMTCEGLVPTSVTTLSGGHRKAVVEGSRLLDY